MSGFVSGFVSSTATVAAMGSRAVSEPKLRRAAVGAAVVSTVATVVLLAIVLGATSVQTLGEVALALVLAGIAAVGYALLVTARMLRGHPPDHFERGRAFDLRGAVVLAALVAGVLVVAGALNEALGERGVTVAAAVAGFADSQSAAVSASTLAGAGKISAQDAAVAALAGFSTNTVSKAVVAYALGKRRYALDVWIGLALVLGAAWAGWALQRAVS